MRHIMSFFCCLRLGTEEGGKLKNGGSESTFVSSSTNVTCFNLLFIFGGQVYAEAIIKFGCRCAMGQCYENEQLGMIEDAIKCYRRAAENGDREG